MADHSGLLKKLLVKPSYRMLVLNAPDGYVEALQPLPEGASIQTVGDGTFDLVQLFVYNKADIDQRAPGAMRAVKPGGLLWFAYPKKTSKIKTDIHRDVGWDTVNGARWEGVTQIAIDDTWSALRFRPVEEIKSRR